MSYEIKVFQHNLYVDVEAGTVTERGDPIQTSEMARRIYQELFDKLKNHSDWKRQTKRITVKSWTEAQLAAEAFTFFLGGAEVEVLVEGGFRVGSKGYYHYIIHQGEL